MNSRFTDFSTWDVTFLPCAGIPIPHDASFSQQWSNTDPWGFFANYTGSYYPNDGCLENFNGGSVNGRWTLEVIDESPGVAVYLGKIIDFSIELCNPAGLDCFNCEPDAGEWTQSNLNSCIGDKKLDVKVNPTYQGNAPDPSDYGYIYVLSQNGNIIQYLDSVDLRTYPAGEYQLCGLSYYRPDEDLLNPFLNGPLNNLVNVLDTSTFCADISGDCFIISIYDPPAPTQINESICAGETYIFGEEILAEAGVYRDTLNRAAWTGCDSVVVLNLTVNNPGLNDIVEAICQDDLPYTLNGKNYDTQGVFLDTLTGGSWNGCDSVLQLDLRIFQSGVNENEVLLCPGESFELNGKVYTEAGLFTDRLPGASWNSCDSLIVVDIRVGSSGTNTVSASICEGLSYALNGKSYNTTGVFRDTITGGSASGCDSLIILDLTVNSPSINVIDTSVCEGGSITVNGLSFSEAGEFEQVIFGGAWTNCDSLIRLKLTVRQNGQLDTAVTICEGTLFEWNDLKFSQIGVYEELIPGGAINGCDTLLFLDLTVNTHAITEINGLICEGSNYSLNGKDYDRPGLYRDTLYNASWTGCDSILFLNLQPAIPVVQQIDTSLCASGSITINGVSYTQPGTFQDTLDIPAANNCDSILLIRITLNEASDTTYLFQTTCQPNEAGIATTMLTNESGCDSLVIIETELALLPVTSLEAGVCNPDSVGISDTLRLSGYQCDSLVVTTFFLLESQNTNIEARTCNPAEVGVEVLTLTNQNGCDSIVTITTTLGALSETFLTAGTCDAGLAETSDTLTLSGSECDSMVITTYFLLETDEVAINQTSCDPSEVGIEVLELTNQNGCDSIVTITTTLGALSETFLTAGTCDAGLAETSDTLTLSGSECDSMVITTYFLLETDEVAINQTSCDPSEVGVEVLELTNQNGCDSIVTITTTLGALSETFLTAGTCDAGLAETSDTLTLSGSECDSMVITTYFLLETDEVAINQTSCNPLEVGIEVLELTNQNGCDSIVTITTTLGALSETFLTAGTCDAGLAETSDTVTLSGSECDSMVITTYFLLETDEVAINQTSCNPLEVGIEVLELTNQNGCDSIVTITTTLGALSETFLTAGTCDAGLAETSDTLTLSGSECDSMVITTYFLLETDEVAINQTSCNPSEVGIEVLELTNQNGCDSIVTITTTLGALSETFLTAGTCDAGLAETSDTLTLSGSECDSMVITTYFLLETDEVAINQTSCDPSEVGIEVLELTNQNGCDSIVTITTTLGALSETFLTAGTCDAGLAETSDTLTLAGSECDSMVITTYFLLETDEVAINQTSCDPSEVGIEVLELTNQNGCDSIVTITTTLGALSETFLTAGTCDAGLAETSDTLTLAGSECDSMVITTYFLLETDAVAINQTSCNPSEVGVEVLELTNQNGCDSIVTITTILGESAETFLTVSTCNPDSVGVRDTVRFSGVLCDSLVITSYAQQEGDFLELNQTSCNPQDTGVFVQTLTNQFGCDSTVVTRVTFDESQEIFQEASTCDAQLAGTSDTLRVSGTSCDTLFITSYVFSASDTTRIIQSTCNPDDAGIEATVFTNEEGCDSVVIIETILDGELQPLNTLIKEISCPGASDGQIQFVGGDNYTFRWQNGMTGAVIDNLGPGNYQVTVSSGDCTNQQSFALIDPLAMELELTAVNGGCGSSGGSISVVSVNGGSAPYQYQWSTAENERAIRDLVSGTYQVTVSDNQGCTTVGEAEIANSGGPLVQAEVQNISCFGANDGHIFLNLRDGAPPYALDWSTGDTTETLEQLGPGQYSVFISDENGCLKAANYFINEPKALELDFSVSGSGGSSNGRVSALVTGGTTPYSYRWSNGQTGPVIENLLTGNYNVTVTDKNGCTLSGQVWVDATTAVDDPDQLAHFLVFPNPARNMVRIEIDFPNPIEGRLLLFSHVGQLVEEITFEAQKLRKQIPLDNYSPGSYLLMVKTNEGSWIEQLIILP